jgi:hypothetical protein
MDDEHRPARQAREAGDDRSAFDRFVETAYLLVSRPPFFFVCVAAVVLWLVSVPLWADLKAWQVAIHTLTSVVTLLLLALWRTPPDAARRPRGRSSTSSPKHSARSWSRAQPRTRSSSRRRVSCATRRPGGAPLRGRCAGERHRRRGLCASQSRTCSMRTRSRQTSTIRTATRKPWRKPAPCEHDRARPQLRGAPAQRPASLDPSVMQFVPPQRSKPARPLTPAAS